MTSITRPPSHGESSSDKSLLIVEDEQSTREYLCKSAGAIDGVTVVAAADSVAAALQVLHHTRPDLVLCDLGLPDGSGTSVISHCARHGIPAMVISIFDDEDTVLQALEAGAVGYLLKDQPVAVLQRAIVDMLAGGSPITPSIARFLLQRLTKTEQAGHTSTPPVNGELDVLSAREKEVLNLLAQGYKSKEVAGQLELSHHTIASHQRNVYAKLSVRNKSEAVAVAIKKGLIDP